MAAARADPDREVCGLLLGQDDVITAVRAAANVAPNPSRTFELDPQVLLRAYREARGGGHRIIGHYHSHPSGSSEPSAVDAEAAVEAGMLWLIVGGETSQIWRVGPRNAENALHGCFHRLQLVVEPH
jgi:desampylase